MKTISATIPILSIVAALVASTQADVLRESYTAFLSERDHQSSSGQRLDNAAAIIRQDRANVHKFGKRDPGDQADRFFSNAANRELLEQFLNRGTSDSAALSKIINGTPSVTVSIYQDEAGNDYVNVTVGENGARLAEPESSEENVLLESYTAFLSEEDHLNSSGKRLDNPAAIIRQDRANVHKLGQRDAEDQLDRFFASAANREILETLLNRGKPNAAAMRKIVNGTPIITVSIYRSPVGANYIEVYLGE